MSGPFSFRRGLAASLLALAATGAHAMDCGPYKAVALQAQSGDLLIALSTPAGVIWKELGGWSLPSTKPFQALAQQALASQVSVLLRYPDPYTGGCTVTDYGTVPVVLRLDTTQ